MLGADGIELQTNHSSKSESASFVINPGALVGEDLSLSQQSSSDILRPSKNGGERETL